jgi:YbgC/YbaW family acyl-CoA thioester hydrolase
VSDRSFRREDLEGPAHVFSRQERAVRFQEVDAAGTIYFPRVLEYFADNYLQLLQLAGLDVPQMLRERTGAAPLAHAEASFVAPLFFGDAVVVELVRARVGGSSVTFGHRLLKGGKLAAYVTTVHVFVDGRTFEKAPVPAGLAQLLLPHASP